MKKKLFLIICIVLMSATSAVASNGTSNDISAWAQVGILFVAVAALLFNSAASRRFSRREVYQRLELASNAIFRFELENSQNTWRLYDEDFDIEDIKKDTSEKDNPEKVKREIMNHITQLLNLFEMSVELHHSKIFSHKIFCTWLIWIYEIAELKTFRYFWHDSLKNHYTGTLGMLIRYSITTMDNGDDFGTFTRMLCEKKLLCERKLPCIKRYCGLAKYLEEHNKKFSNDEY